MRKFNKPEDFLFESFFTHEKISYQDKLYTIQEILIDKEKTTLCLIDKNLQPLKVVAMNGEVTLLFQPANA